MSNNNTEISVDEYGIIEILRKHNAESALSEITAVFDKFCEAYLSSREDIRNGAFTEVNCYLLNAIIESEDDNPTLRQKIESIIDGLDKKQKPINREHN